MPLGDDMAEERRRHSQGMASATWPGNGLGDIAKERAWYRGYVDLMEGEPRAKPGDVGRLRFSQPGFLRVAVIAWAMQALIVVSGAAVRLTEAGLGCEDWPTCNDDELLPEWELHGLIEFGNRVISALVAVSAVFTVVAAYRRLPRRGDLIKYAWALVAGTLAQVVLGGITVLADLHPIVVSVHFLFSMLLLWAAQTLVFRSRSTFDPEIQPNPDQARWFLLGMAALVLMTGTIVTGTGPNSGDSRADRLGFELESVVRIHSICAWLLIATTVFMAWRIVQNGGQATHAFTVVRWLLVALVAQGAIGYTQFALGVPAALVEIHVAGSIVVWSLAIALFLQLGELEEFQPSRTSFHSKPVVKTGQKVPEWWHGSAS